MVMLRGGEGGGHQGPGELAGESMQTGCGRGRLWCADVRDGGGNRALQQERRQSRVPCRALLAAHSPELAPVHAQQALQQRRPAHLRAGREGAGSRGQCCG